MFSDRPSLPTSVRGSRSGTRRPRFPAAIASAVCSMSLSGRILDLITAIPTMVSTASRAPLMIRSMIVSSSSVLYCVVTSRPTMMVPLTSWPDGLSKESAELTTRQRPLPEEALTVTGAETGAREVFSQLTAW